MALLLTAPVLGVDLDGDGMCDVWQDKFGARGLPAAGDKDGDGQSNAFESRAGTDPRDPQSVFKVSRFHIDEANMVVRWPSQAGKHYRVARSPDLTAADWTPVSPFQPADAAETEWAGAGGVGDPYLFFCLQVTDGDQDEDGLSDWAEMQLPGYEPDNKQSAYPGVDDLEAYSKTGPVTVNVETLTPTATEKEGAAARFRVTRTGGMQPITVRFAMSGNPDPTKGSASPADYELRRGNNTVNRQFTMAFGSEAVNVTVRPVRDQLIETPETLTMTILNTAEYTAGQQASAAVTITDAANTADNERLFVAYLSPSPGSSATGLATVRLPGDNAVGLVGLSFSGLTTPQTTSFIDLNNGGPGNYVKGLPSGQVSGNSWPVKAASFLATDQAMLEALLAGNVSVVVNTTQFLEGEIRGNFLPAQGSIEPPPPTATPPIEELTGDALKNDVARFLTQATFGPTEGDIEDLHTRITTVHGGDRLAAYEAWIDGQLALDQTSLEAYARAADEQYWLLSENDAQRWKTSPTPRTTPLSYNLRHAWWMVSAGAHDQLRQRIGFALSEIFVVSVNNNPQVNLRHYGVARYYDQLAAAASGNFRSLLEDVSKSPVMALYLSHLKNQKEVIDPVTNAVLVSPDENYAREVMQLFSIGLVQLHPDGSLKLDSTGAPVPTYANDDIVDLARVLTGWSFSKRHDTSAAGLAAGFPVVDNTNFLQDAGPQYYQASWRHPMKNFGEYHDTGSKKVLGQTIPAGLSGEQDLAAALDIIFHHPNTPMFISRLLIQRLVTSNPSAGYIRRVAGVFADNGGGVRGDLRAVVKAILLDPEARNLSFTRFVGFGKQKEPMVRYTQLLRAFGARSQLPLSALSAFGYPESQLDNFAPNATRLRFLDTDSDLWQTPLSAPTVFNWFLPNYSPGGSIAAAGQVAPEMQLANEESVIRSANFHSVLLTGAQSGLALQQADPTHDDVGIDRTVWEQFYDSQIADGKTATQAVTAVVDRLDDLLMAGGLRRKYADAPLPNPRHSIIAAASNQTDPAFTTPQRITNILYLLANSTEFLHQK